MCAANRKLGSSEYDRGTTKQNVIDPGGFGVRGPVHEQGNTVSETARQHTRS